jgi:hypothetical protein
MAPYLWMMSTQSSSNINALNQQIVKGRQLIITEDPRLHCVWIADRIFLKPLPAFLASHAFWHVYLLAGHDSPLLPPDDDPAVAHAQLDSVVRAARGYLRTWSLLVQHPSDFRLAQAHGLVPAGVSFGQLLALTAGLRITDADVSARYAYGELRLTRLNFYGKFILRRWHFMRVQTQDAEYFARFYGPLLFIFTVVSIVLNALQVGMAVEQAIGSVAPNAVGDSPLAVMAPWIGLWELSRWVAVLCGTVVSVLALVLILMLMSFHVDEWTYAIKDRTRKKRELRRTREV